MLTKPTIPVAVGLPVPNDEFVTVTGDDKVGTIKEDNVENTDKYIRTCGSWIISSR